MRVRFAIPGDILTRTGGYLYDRRIMALLPARGIEVEWLPLSANFPFPTQADLAAARRAFGAAPGADVIVADGLAWGACPAEFAAAAKAPVIALCHHPLGLEAGLSAAQSAYFLNNEREILAASAHVIVTSAATAVTLVKDFAVPPGKLTVAEPGVDPAPRARGGTGAPHIIAVGSVVPRKGQDILVEALAHNLAREWRCTIVGGLDRAPEFAAGVRARIDLLGLNERIALVGEVDEAALDAIYATADIFVSASHYEGYGMVLTEALARGLPIVTTTGGASASTAPDCAALKVPPGDSRALGAAIARLLDGPALRRELADAAWALADALPRWEDTADRFAAAIKMVAAGAAATSS